MELIIIVAVVLTAAFLLFLKNQNEEEQKKKEIADKLGTDDILPGGNLLKGYPGIEKELFVKVAISQGVFHIVSDNTGNEVGRIPLPDIADIRIADKSFMTERVTLTRFHFMGMWAFLMKKETPVEHLFLTIVWRQNAAEYSTVFEFGSAEEAQTVAEALLNAMTALRSVV